jgi:hypothetical protein
MVRILCKRYGSLILPVNWDGRAGQEATFMVRGQLSGKLMWKETGERLDESTCTWRYRNSYTLLKSFS